MGYAELEVVLRKRGDENYSVEMWLRPPDSDADRQLVGDETATFQIDRGALLRAGNHPKAYGAVLSAAFFRDPAVGKAFAEARSAAGDGLRVRFFIHSNVAELHALPWERLADPDTLVAPDKLTDPEILKDPAICRPLLTRENLFFSRYLSSADRRRACPCAPNRTCGPSSWQRIRPVWRSSASPPSTWRPKTVRRVKWTGRAPP